MWFTVHEVFCSFVAMKAERLHANAPGKKLGACVCLLALALLWTPAWALAFQTSQMACCTAGMCPLHDHAPKKSPDDAAAPRHGQAAECSHHQQQAAMDCSMQCCHRSDPAVAATAIFLLPGTVPLFPQLLIVCAEQLTGPHAKSIVFEPAAPPPRS